jgi:hypothetical protein
MGAHICTKSSDSSCASGEPERQSGKSDSGDLAAFGFRLGNLGLQDFQSGTDISRLGQLLFRLGTNLLHLGQVTVSDSPLAMQL